MCVSPRRVALVVSLSFLFPALARGDDPPPDLGPMRGPLTEALREAARDAEAIPEGWQRAYALRDVGKALLRMGDRDGARDALRRAAATYPDSPSAVYCSALAAGLARAGDREAARPLFRRAEELTGPDCEDSLQLVEDLLFLAVDEAVAHDDESARRAARRASEVARRLGDYGQNQSRIEDLLAIQRRIGDRDGLEATLGTIARGLEDDIDRSLAEFREAYPESNVEVAYYPLLGLDVAAGRLDEAIARAARRRSGSLLARVADSLMPAEDWLDLALGDDGDPEAARRAVARLHELADGLDGVDRAFALAAIAGAESRLGEFDAALATARRIGRIRGFEVYQAAPLITLARARHKAGDDNAARDLLREAFDLWASRPDDPRDGAAVPIYSAAFFGLDSWFGAIARAQAEVGDLDGARASYQALPREADYLPPEPDNPGAEPAPPHLHPFIVFKQAEILAALARGWAHAGERTAALQAADDAEKKLDEASDLGGDTGNLLILGPIAAARAEAGDVDAAIRTAERVADAGDADAFDAKDSILRDAAAACARAGDLPGAVRVVGVIADLRRGLPDADPDYDRVHRDWDLGFVAQDFVEANAPEPALRWATALPTPGERCSVLRGIAVGVTQKGKAKR